MKTITTEIEKFNKGTQYESNVLVVNVSDACNYQGQFTEAINLVHSENRDLNLNYFFAEKTKDNIYRLCFSIKK
jgi:hypothetical protein